MNENYYELQALQVQREERLNYQEFKKWKQGLNEQALKADGSNTPFAGNRLLKQGLSRSVIPKHQIQQS